MRKGLLSTSGAHYTSLSSLAICAFVIVLSFDLYALSADSPITEEELYQQCKQLFSEGSFTEAGRHIESFLSSHPESEHDGEIRFMQAFLQPDLDTSAKMYQAITEKHSGGKWAAKSYFQLGQCYYLQDKYDEALDHYGKIIVSYPEDETYWPARYWKCRSLIAKGDYKTAMTALRSLEESDSKKIGKDMILMAVGSCYLGMKDYEHAAAAYRSLIESIPDSQRIPAAYLLLARSQQNLGKLEEAKKLYQKVIGSYRQSIEAQQAQKYLNSLSTPQPEPTKTPPVKAASYFTIQIGAFSSKRNADRLAGQLRKKSYTVNITPPVAGKSNLYKVTIGKFKTRAAALRVARQLGKNEKLDTEVVSQ